MMGALHIAGRELREYFNSVLGYVFLTLTTLVTGGFFWALLQSYAAASEEAAGNPMAGSLPGVTEVVIGYLFSNFSIILIFAGPLFTMRLLAEERRHHTLELLMTAPISSFEIVLGKFLGALAFMGVALLMTLHFPIMLWQVAQPELGPILTCYLGGILLSSVFISLGLLASSLTQHQLVAGVISFTIGLFLMVIVSWITGDSGGAIWKYLSLTEHYESFVKGVIRSETVLYFVSLTLFFLFATQQRLEALRRQ